MGDALLAAILANPDDVAARGVYADRLLAAGDPRGELIQIQCAIVALFAPDAPPWSDAHDVQHAALRTRERRLLAKHKTAWLAPLQPYVKRATFARGFPESIEIDAAKLVDGATALAKLTPIVKLHVTGVTAAIGPKLAACALLQRVAALSFARGKLTAKIAAALFAKLRLPRTREISLGTNPNLAGGVQAFAQAIAGSTALRELNLDDTGLDGPGVDALIAAHPRGLTHLALLRNPRIAGPGIAALAAAPMLASVRDLNLFDCDLGDGLVALADSRQLGALERLVVHRNGISDRAARALLDAARAGRFPALAEVWIHDNAVSAATAAELAQRYPSPMI